MPFLSAHGVAAFKVPTAISAVRAERPSRPFTLFAVRILICEGSHVGRCEHRDPDGSENRLDVPIDGAFVRRNGVRSKPS